MRFICAICNGLDNPKNPAYPVHMLHAHYVGISRGYQKLGSTGALHPWDEYVVTYVVNVPLLTSVIECDRCWSSGTSGVYWKIWAHGDLPASAWLQCRLGVPVHCLQSNGVIIHMTSHTLYNAATSWITYYSTFPAGSRGGALVGDLGEKVPRLKVVTSKFYAFL